MAELNEPSNYTLQIDAGQALYRRNMYFAPLIQTCRIDAGRIIVRPQFSGAYSTLPAASAFYDGDVILESGHRFIISTTAISFNSINPNPASLSDFTCDITVTDVY
jgi:hypothetical protein